MCYPKMNEPEDKLVQKCSELIYAICKAKRFGWFNSHPDTLEKNNIYKIVEEIVEVQKAIDSFSDKISHLVAEYSTKLIDELGTKKEV